MIGSNRRQQQIQVENKNVDKRLMTDQQMDLIGSTLTFKIKDSLYIGTSIEAFKDQQFILLNWVQNIVVIETNEYKFDSKIKSLYYQENQQSTKNENESEDQCIRYLHCNPQVFKNAINLSNQDQSELSEKLAENKLIARDFQQVFDFIEASQQKGTSCLILSSSHRAKIQMTGYIFAICTAYMMKKYCWSLYKSLQFMNARHPNASISQESLGFLNNLEIDLMKSASLTYNWQEWKDHNELIIRNTFLNGKEQNWNETYRKNNKSLINQKVYEIVSKSAQKTSQKSSFQLQSILKNSNNNVKMTSKQKKVTINQQLNKTEQFLANLSKKTIDQFQSQANSLQSFAFKQTKRSQQHDDSTFQAFKTARSKRISLSVRNLVAKYQSQHSKHYLAQNSKKLTSDDSASFNAKGLNKKKSFYNFQSCQRFIKNQSEKNINNDGIQKILNKLKTQTNYPKVQQKQTVKLRTLPDQNEVQRQNYQESIKTQPTIDISNLQSIKKSSKNNSWLQIINKKISHDQSSDRKKNDKESLSKSINNQEQRINLKSKEKENQTKIFIKEVKKSSNKTLTQRKISINQKLFNQQVKKKEKNLIIEFQDFKQMIKSKSKSIGNLTLQNIENFTKKQDFYQKNEKISSVIQKLKKQSLQNASSSSITKINFNLTKDSKKCAKDIEIKWR